ncbi:hypothetical protein COB52_04975 [Candidatus Kaiserbacteria bacterium]|nr:MAG: hypothetical protein COB52_04975 [Candidatus Kaiserbacteria bacterium]
MKSNINLDDVCENEISVPANEDEKIPVCGACDSKDIVTEALAVWKNGRWVVDFAEAMDCECRACDERVFIKWAYPK